MSARKTTYTAHASQDGHWWVLTVPELDRVYTQVLSLSRAKSMVTEVITLVHDLDPESFDVEVEIRPAWS